MPEKNLPDAELEVMACLWRKGKATAREIREEMAPYRPMAHGSTVSLLKRLEAKGLVRKEKGAVGKAFVYESTRKPNTTHRRLVRKLVDRVFGGDGLSLVASLFETRPPSARQIDEMQRMLDALRDKKSSAASRASAKGRKSR
jgi:BlaI family transcriptional regulator, penicillinase repressor